MIQTLALLLDSYRELNSKKLFWITLTFSVMIVLLFLGLGIDSEGVTIAGFHVPFLSEYNTTIVSQETFFKATFFQFGVNIWLTWIAAILAIVSTAGIFPDLITGGSIDLYLSKPIGRFRLFLTKYMAGLLFVALQVGVFVAGSILVLRIRGGIWLPRICFALPIVLLFYSYLHCVAVLLGMVTRSTVATIILTITFWTVIAAVQVIESGSIVPQKIKYEMIAARLERNIAVEEHRVKTGESEASVWKVDSHKRLEDLAEEQRDNNKTLRMLTNVYHWAHCFVAIFPKTEDTVGLLRTSLISSDEDRRVAGEFDEADTEHDAVPLIFNVTTDDIRAKNVAQRIVRERPISWSIGSSLVFEAVIISIAAWLFCRRDY